MHPTMILLSIGPINRLPEVDPTRKRTKYVNVFLPANGSSHRVVHVIKPSLRRDRELSCLYGTRTTEGPRRAVRSLMRMTRQNVQIRGFYL